MITARFQNKVNVKKETGFLYTRKKQVEFENYKSLGVKSN